MNPLEKARDRAGSAWGTARDGTKRTAGWVKGGVTGVFSSSSDDSSNPGKSSSKTASTKPTKEPGPVRDGIAGAWDKVGGAGLIARGKADSRVGAALIVGAIVFVLWIAWTIYVWSENGSTAGLGVLISWPAVIAAIALVASPFVAAGVLIKRMAEGGGPSLAMAGGGTTTETATGKAEKPEAEAADDEDAAEDETDEDEDAEDDEEPAGEGDGDSDDDEDSEAA